jgi:hypothetical protein
MKFKEVFTVTGFKEKTGGKTPIVEAKVFRTTFKGEVEKYIFTAFGEEAEKIKKAVGFTIVADCIIMTERGEYPSGIFLKNIELVNRKKITEPPKNERQYDENYY